MHEISWAITTFSRPTSLSTRDRRAEERSHPDKGLDSCPFLANPTRSTFVAGHKTCAALHKESEKTCPVNSSLGEGVCPTPRLPPTVLTLHSTKKYFFLFVLNLLSSIFSVLISHDRQLSDFLLAFSMNLNHPVNRH